MTAKKLSLILLIVLVAIFAISAIIMASARAFTGVRVVDRSILVINLEKEFPEMQRFQFDLFGGGIQTPFYKLISSVYSAADNENIEAILLKGYSLQNLSKSWEIAQALKHFKSKQKPIYGYFEYGGLSNLLLASLCDTVAMPSQGEWLIPGISANMLFLRGTLAKLGISFDVIQMGKYKDAAEMLANDSMSVYMRESYNKLLDDLYFRFISDCADGYHIPYDSVNAMIDAAMLTSQKAKEFGIVDTILFWEDFKEHLVGDDEERFITVARYSSIASKGKLADKNIALIIASGAVASGDEQQWSEGITPKKYAKLIRETADDEDIDAIVMRVDSPGGSALTSDIIRAEMVRAAEKKPLIVSMGSVAASGGYYISMAADTIFATPYTITGSIGVIMIRPNLEQMYKKIGACPQKLKRGKYADMFAADHPMTDDERGLLELAMEDIYNQFVSKAAADRDTSYSWIDSVGQGRVWSAQCAESLSLVDSLGSLHDAIALTEKILQVSENEHARIIVKPKPASLFSMAETFMETGFRNFLYQSVFREFALYEIMEELSGKPLYLWTGEIDEGKAEK